MLHTILWHQRPCLPNCEHTVSKYSALRSLVLGLLKPSKEFSHVAHHLVQTLHASEMTTEISLCIIASPRPSGNRRFLLSLQNFRFVVVVSGAALNTGYASKGKLLTPNGTIIRFSSLALNSVYTSWRTLL